MRQFIVPRDRRFAFGRLFITMSADEQLDEEDVSNALKRHLQGDWGDLSENDKASNEEALKTDTRLLSSYHDKKGVKFWVLTEADRSVTTVLLPDDY
jgi:hypothetical protein